MEETNYIIERHSKTNGIWDRKVFKNREDLFEYLEKKKGTILNNGGQLTDIRIYEIEVYGSIHDKESGV